MSNEAPSNRDILAARYLEAVFILEEEAKLKEHFAKLDERLKQLLKPSQEEMDLIRSQVMKNPDEPKSKGEQHAKASKEDRPQVQPQVRQGLKPSRQGRKKDLKDRKQA